MPKKLTPDEVERRRKEKAEARELMMLQLWEAERL
jgi:hypothetical protein